MTSALSELVNILTLEKIGDDLYLGVGSKNDGADATYGGHLLGQATKAAIETVESGKNIHSLHAYFLSGGIPGEAITYFVERLRDGRSFCSRRVVAMQKNKKLLELNASFCVKRVGLKFSVDAPEDFHSLPSPESLPRYKDLMLRQDPMPFREDWALEERGVDVRVVNAPWGSAGLSDRKGIRMWIRLDGQLKLDAATHAAILAYQSDESLADNVLTPFGLTWGSTGVFLVSLDHSMWFHDVIDLNSWYFVEQWPVYTGSERGVASAHVWNAKGNLVASFTQEALVRFNG